MPRCATLLDATLLSNGSAEFGGENHSACSTAADFARETATGRRVSTNGWVFWQYTDLDDNVRVLHHARQYLKHTRPPAAQPVLKLAGKIATAAR